MKSKGLKVIVHHASNGILYGVTTGRTAIQIKRGGRYPVERKCEIVELKKSPPFDEPDLELNSTEVHFIERPCELTCYQNGTINRNFRNKNRLKKRGLKFT